MNKRTFWHLASLAWSLFLGIAMLIPSDKISHSKLFSFDKLLHMGVFLIYTLLLSFSIVGKGPVLKEKIKGLVVALTISIVYGTALEYLQQFTPGRTTDSYDLLANIFGAVLGSIVFITFNKISLRFLN